MGILQKKWHQNLTIDDMDMPAENVKRKNSNFWNEGKWNNFIKPLLPPDPQERTFIEIGSNVGLYLKLAKEYGFKYVIGVEKDKSACEMAEYYKKKNKLDYKIINATMGNDFNVDDLPVADVVLFANSHYYISLENLVKIIDRFLYRSQYCILVSRHLSERSLVLPNVPSGEINDLRLLFKDWIEVANCNTQGMMLKNDPHARILWSLLFKGKLERLPIDKYLKSYFFTFSLRDLTKRISLNRKVIPEQTRYYKKWKERNVIWHEHKSDIDIMNIINERIALIKSLIRDGQRERILVDFKDKILDGGTRSTIMQRLGYKSILVRRI